MLTRRIVNHQYGQQDGAPPPFHVHMAERQQPAPGGRGRLYGAGGLLGGAVTLTSRGFTGMRVGNSGYGYLGMDPSDPTTWPRPFNPQPGMIGWLNFYGDGA
jgi:hypothetical protein